MPIDYMTLCVACVYQLNTVRQMRQNSQQSRSRLKQL